VKSWARVSGWKPELNGSWSEQWLYQLVIGSFTSEGYILYVIPYCTVQFLHFISNRSEPSLYLYICFFITLSHIGISVLINHYPFYFVFLLCFLLFSNLFLKSFLIGLFRVFLINCNFDCNNHC